MWRVLHVRMSCTRIFLYSFFFSPIPIIFLSLVAGKWLSAGAVVLFESGLSFAERYIGGESLAVTRCVFVALIGTPTSGEDRSDFACGRSKFAQMKRDNFRVFSL